MYQQLRLFPDEPWLYAHATVLNGRLTTPNQPPPSLGVIFDGQSQSKAKDGRSLALLLFGWLPGLFDGDGCYYRGFAVTWRPLRVTITLKRWHKGVPEVAFISERTRAKAIASLFLRSSGGELDWKRDIYA